MDSPVLLGLAGIIATLSGAAIGAVTALSLAKREGQVRERHRFTEAKRLAFADFLAMTDRAVNLAEKTCQAATDEDASEPDLVAISSTVDQMVDDFGRAYWAIMLVAPQMQDTLEFVGAALGRLGASMISGDDWETALSGLVDAERNFARVARGDLGVRESD